MHRPNYSGPEFIKRFAAHDSDIHVILKYGQGHQTWCDLLDPKQGYNHAKFDRHLLNSVCQKANAEVFVKSDNMSIISLACVQKWKLVLTSLQISS